MACALDVSKMRSDLNKLNKDVLIDIIVNRSIPDRISVSDNMRKYIKNQFEEKFDEFYDATSSNLKISNEIDQLKCNLKISIVERNALQRLVKELENTTKNQEMLIDLLKENRKSTTAELVEPNHNVATPQGPVMIPGRKSVIGHNKEAVWPIRGASASSGRSNLNALPEIATVGSVAVPIPSNRFEPYFDALTPQNVTALVGKSAYLTCRVRNLGNKTHPDREIQD
ncbi:hypothetical protein WA026_008773 [Henosepilachna vigintioctopunctata]|uniref:Ig-like domain-containing protein n=1 Tax=Henosepilachna vigintioctopunctata TaxID=420089 RepID=A0AAW1V966_9CUCU